MMWTPKDLSALSAVQLIELAIARHEAFKVVSTELQTRDTDTLAARLLIAAYRDDRAQPFLVAHLLGCLREPEGYPVAREILLAAVGRCSESYAGVAMAEIAGIAARDDLLGIMMSDGPKRVREGAAAGLSKLADPELAEVFLAAFRAGCIRHHCAGIVVASLPGSAKLITGWLTGDDVCREAVAIEAAVDLTSTTGSIDRALATAIERSLRARRVNVAPSIRRMLRERIAPLLDSDEALA